MIFRSPSRTIWKHAQTRCNQSGAFICLKWVEWSGSIGEPYKDPTTGARLSDSSQSGQAPTQVTCRTRAFTYFVQPAKSVGRIYSEIQVGDAICDFIIPLFQVSNPGSTSLALGQIIDVFQLGAINRALTSGQTPATVNPDRIKVESLKGAAVCMYRSKYDWENDVHGESWVQKEVGTELAKSWESVYGNQLLGEAVLLRKGT
jgi:hypothetical protein